MPDTICRGTMDCHKCPRSVANTITHVFHRRGYHLPAQRCEYNLILFLLKGQLLVNSDEYAGVTLHSGEFILQAVASKLELLAMTEVECLYFNFPQPELFCEGRLNHIVNNVPTPLILSPLKVVPALDSFLQGLIHYASSPKVCRELLSLKRKEIAYVLSFYYNDYDLASLVSPLAKYMNSFHYFVYRNYAKIKTVEEFAKLGGYSEATFRRIFANVFHIPVYEWILERRREDILYDLQQTDESISAVCYKYGFESLPNFSNFCKKNFGASPRKLRSGVVDLPTELLTICESKTGTF